MIQSAIRVTERTETPRVSGLPEIIHRNKGGSIKLLGTRIDHIHGAEHG